MTGPKNASRRTFLQTSAAATAAASSLAAWAPNAHAAGSDVIKVGLIGCGGRGTGAAEQSVTAAPNVKLHAMGDMFPDHLATCRKSLKEKLGDRSTWRTTAASPASTPTKGSSPAAPT